jgi:hypothetical protein
MNESCVPLVKLCSSLKASAAICPRSTGAESHMLRSSYRGYLGYGLVGTSAVTPSGTDDLIWQELCNNGKGKYDYQAQANGFSTGTGCAPTGYTPPNQIGQAKLRY